MSRSRKINLEKVQASLNTGFTITPYPVKRFDFERIECPECGGFRPAEQAWPR